VSPTDSTVTSATVLAPPDPRGRADRSRAAEVHTPLQRAGEACAAAAAPRLPAGQAQAWVGFLAAHAELTRALDAGLANGFGLSLSELEVMAQIAWETEGSLRMSDIAEMALLSQSRVSRIVDQLEARGLVERVSCPSDSRGVFAQITEAGRELVSRALDWHWGQVQERFFATLSEAQVRELGAIWQGILGQAPQGSAAP
jgi:DNA-binding MarR family transcriptional regulator